MTIAVTLRREDYHWSHLCSFSDEIRADLVSLKVNSALGDLRVKFPQNQVMQLIICLIKSRTFDTHHTTSDNVIMVTSYKETINPQECFCHGNTPIRRLIIYTRAHVSLPSSLRVCPTFSCVWSTPPRLASPLSPDSLASNGEWYWCTHDEMEPSSSTYLYRAIPFFGCNSSWCRRYGLVLHSAVYGRWGVGLVDRSVSVFCIHRFMSHPGRRQWMPPKTTSTDVLLWE